MTDSLERLRASLSDRYRLERELGAGGMATVYLADDLKHERQVAVKVLRPELAAVIGAERFLAEIKTTAHLQHPHILPLFDSGEADSFLFYVMPYVEGISLRDQMTREKQLPINEAIRIASEVASALDYAHRHGVIHRDIKPENILLHDGSALVADFGIALAASKAGTRMTETGMSLGTPQYMSPEQAMGERDLDARSDVYALGCVLYEMLTGEPPFTGPTAQAIVAKVMSALPTPPEQLRQTVAPAINNAVMMALQKLPADRFRTAAEFAAALAPGAVAVGRPGHSAASRSARRNRAPWFAALGVCSVAAFLLGGQLLGRHGGAPVVLGRATHLTWDPGLEVMPALSPDGKSVAYAAGPIANLHIMVRAVGGGREARLTGDTVTDEASPTWYPDGSRVLFLSRGGAFSAPAGGGPPRPEITVSDSMPVFSAVISPDGKRLAFTRRDTLWLRGADDQERSLSPMREGTLCGWSPDGRFIACATGNVMYTVPGAFIANLSPGRIMLARVSDGHLTTVTDSISLNTSPAWSADGKWLYFVSNRDGQRDIYGVAISAAGEASGPAIRLSAGLSAHTISTAGTGTELAYSLYTARTSIWSMPLPARSGGTTTDATRISNANEYIEQMAVSKDGNWVYYDSNLAGDAELFRIPTNGGEAERLTNNPADDFTPDPSPDGKSFSFHSWRTGSRDIFVQQLDGSGIEQVTHTPRQEAVAAWSPDGNALAFSELTEAGGIWLVHRDLKGRWGEPVQRLNFGNIPRWSPDGRELLFLKSITARTLLTVPVDSGPARTVMDDSRPGQPIVDLAAWLDTRTILFASHDDRGNALAYTVPASGGTPVPYFRYDPVRHPSLRNNFVVGNGRFYFTSEDRQSDVWVMELRRTP